MAVFSDPAVLAEHIQTLWNERIPLAGYMEVQIGLLDDKGLTASAPLEKNCNHMGTAFAGSLQGLATLVGWGVALALAGDQPDTHLVIQEGAVKFLHPVTGDFTAFCPLPDEAQIKKYRHQLEHKGRARIVLDVEVTQGDKVVVTFTGSFVALKQG